MNIPKKFAVIGGGSWGTALACAISRAVGDVILYTDSKNSANEINKFHRNSQYLGDSVLPYEVKATNVMKDAIDSDLLILAVPSHALASVLDELNSEEISPSTILLVATKGLCNNPVQFFSTKIESEMNNPYAFISGPNFAKEVADDKFTSVTIASQDIVLSEMLAQTLSSDNFQAECCSDIITIQIAGIVKNVIAIRSGMMQAQGGGKNALAWLVSKGLEEIAIISKALGGNSKTLTMPAIVGDLVLTSYSNTSRNTKFGYEFHKNNYSKDFIDSYPTLVEGVSSARLLTKFLQPYNLKLPIINSVTDLL